MTSVSQTRINIRSVANSAKAKTIKRNGRDLIVVPSATLPDNIVMNGIMYPAEEIANSYKTLERTPAPFGHPTVNGKFVSASDPEGINIGYIGAWNENVRRQNGIVYLDKVIDVEVANRTQEGQAVLEAIRNAKPIHTSTGLLCEIKTTNVGGQEMKVATNMLFDHDAILLNEEGAATPEQGVGMLVNGKEIEVVNSAIDWADRSLDYAAMSVVSALEEQERATLAERIKQAVLALFSPSSSTQPPTQETDMGITDEQFAALSAKVNTVADQVSSLVKDLPTTLATAVNKAVEPVTAVVNKITETAAAAEKLERDALVNTIVKANLMNQDLANTLPTPALKELAAKVGKPGTAAALNANSDPILGNASEEKGYDLNALFAEGK
jgi:hypothetical protein